MIHKKMFIRDINKHKEGFIGSIIIIAIGLMIFTSFSLVLINLSLEKEKFYEEQNFSDVFIKVKEMPYKDIDRLKNIKGIKHIEGRLIKDVRLYKDKKAIDKYIRLISYDFEKDFVVNDVDLIEPKEIKLDNNQIIIDNKFIEANNLNIDDEIEIITDSNVDKLTIKGFGRSPEFIYALRTSSDIYPEPKKFGIGFVNKDYMSKLFEEGSNINDITIILQGGTNFNELKNILEGKLEKYGLFYIIERKNQVSNLLLSEEIKGLKSMSKTIPIMFLMVSSMILYIILKRMIESKRGQIGILKAMGYKKIEIQIHYISYAFFVGILGGIVGSISGYFLSIPFTNIYSEFFNMPNIKAEFSFRYLIYSVMMSLFFSISAGYMGTKKILDLTPANSLRKEVPIFNKKLFIENSKVLWNMFNVQGKMAVRNIKRDIKRSIFIIFTISFTGALLIFSLSMKTMSEEMLFDKYKNEELYKAKIDLDNYYNEDDILREFKNKYNLKGIEGVLNIPAKAKFKWYEKDISITAINDNNLLYRILDSQKNRVDLSKDGIYISQRLSKLLDAKVNDEILLSFVDSRNKDNEKRIRINGVIPQYLGIGVYSNLDYAKTFLDSKKIINTVLI
ncbi:MAG: FtsX-like permease family protein, partial [Peptostreptococcaceae bacterium]|nr:FtsX-like permease family protein [Peptostreptococcaceae bacterium]